MNSLEFIEKEIRRRKNSIRKLNEQPPQVKKYFLIAKKNDELQTLHQIKTELEAWEVVKSKLKINIDDIFRIQKDFWLSIFFTNYTSEDCEDQLFKLKKALEVKDE